MEKKSKQRKRKSSRAINAAIDKDLVSHAYLKQNAEDWNRPASVFPTSPGRCGHRKRKDSPDGRYAFKRRRGCVYRAPWLPSSSASSPPVNDDPAFNDQSFHRTYFPPRFSGSGVLRCIGIARRRVGRGGRYVQSSNSFFVFNLIIFVLI